VNCFQPPSLAEAAPKVVVEQLIFAIRLQSCREQVSACLKWFVAFMDAEAKSRAGTFAASIPEATTSPTAGYSSSHHRPHHRLTALRAWRSR
jgi:hypothetical protein